MIIHPGICTYVGSSLPVVWGKGSSTVFSNIHMKPGPQLYTVTPGLSKLVYLKTSFIQHSTKNHHHYSVYNLPWFIQYLVYPTHFMRNKCGQVNEGLTYSTLSHPISIYICMCPTTPTAQSPTYCLCTGVYTYVAYSKRRTSATLLNEDLYVQPMLYCTLKNRTVSKLDALISHHCLKAGVSDFRNSLGRSTVRGS